MTNSAKLLVAVVVVGMLLLQCGSAMATGMLGIVVGDRVWLDLNDDGVQDANEPGINGVTVTLTDASGVPVEGITNPQQTLNPVNSTATGFYKFPFMTAGETYTITISGVQSGTRSDTGLAVPSDLVLTSTVPSEAGVCDILAQGQNADGSYYAQFVLHTDYLKIDFGFNAKKVVAKYEIGDRVWHDINYNGVQDAGEEGINGATVRLLDAAGNVLKTTSTDTVNGVDGYYLFTGLDAGKYIVEVSGTPLGWACTYDLDLDNNSNSGIFSLTANRYDVDFGYAEVPDTGFCTFTQGGWGAKPKGNNPGTILRDNWVAVFGDQGLTVGGTNTIHFSNWSDVTNFLPQGGTAAALTTSYLNPTKKISVLAGQVVALRLNVEFSSAGITQFGIGTKEIQSGLYDGQTVGQFLLAAEAALGGAPGYDLAAINDTATKINESFDNGTTNTGFIK